MAAIVTVLLLDDLDTAGHTLALGGQLFPGLGDSNFTHLGQDVIRQIHSSIFDLGVSDYDKVKLIDKCGEIEFRIVEGSNERIQLEALLAYFLMIGGNAR